MGQMLMHLVQNMFNYNNVIIKLNNYIMFCAMFHTHNKWEDVVTTSNPPIQPTISQTLSYSTFMGVQQIPPNQQILHLQQQDLTITPPNGIVPTGYTWSVVTGVNYFTLRVYSGETTNTPIFATSFPLGLQRPKECIIQCILTYSGGTYTIPYVLRWQRQQPEDVIATITNGSNSYVVNGNNSVFTQQPFKLSDQLLLLGRGQ